MENNKFLNKDGIKILWRQLSLHDYPNNETLVAIINAIDETKADKATTLAGYGIENAYTKKEIDEYELITVEDIDAICGISIEMASEVLF